MALLTLDDAKAQLNIPTAADDVELGAYVDSVTAVIERYVGPVEVREHTETIVGRGCTLCLSAIPAIELISLTSSSGTVLDVGGLELDGATGIVHYPDGSFAGQRWRVVYQAGRPGAVPPTINLAARMLLQHLWRTQNASRGPVLAGGDDYSVTDHVPGFGYAVPNRVLQLLEPYKLPPGVA